MYALLTKVLLPINEEKKHMLNFFVCVYICFLSKEINFERIMMTKLMQIWQIQSCTKSEDHVINHKPNF